MDKRSFQLRKSQSGSHIIYVMSRDQRVRDNHALIAAQTEALEHSLPLVVVFNLLPATGYRRQEHYRFMVDGLKRIENDLLAKNIAFVIKIGDMAQNLKLVARELNPRTIYFDFSPLRGPRNIQKMLARELSCGVKVVDTHNIVPTWVTSDKEEFAAHTIRRKLHKILSEWIDEPTPITKHPHSVAKTAHSVSWREVDDTVAAIPKNGITHSFISGEDAGLDRLREFIDTGLTAYGNNRNDPGVDAQSNLSPYLHFGQLSALRVVLSLMNNSSHTPHLFTSSKMPGFEGSATLSDGIDAFIEELVVRKELSDNYCLHNKNYDKLAGAKEWAKQTLKQHKTDIREHIYTKEQLENALTHDELWNAAQKQLTTSGKIHGYMRMYWAKKILEWTKSPATAIKWAVELNDTYNLDGGDPNGYVGIMWSIAGVHDRPWFDRSIYGKIRYMSRSGLDKKFDTQKYISLWR